MAYDPNDPEQVAAVNAAKVAVTTALETAHASKVAELTGKISAAETAAATARQEADAAKASGTATASQLAALEAKAAAAETRAAALETADNERKTAADKAIVDALPEALRPLVLGKSGADLKTAADLLVSLNNKAAPGRGAVDGGAESPSEADIEWAKANGYAQAKPDTIIRASKAFGPRAEAERKARKAS